MSRWTSGPWGSRMAVQATPFTGWCLAGAAGGSTDAWAESTGQTAQCPASRQLLVPSTSRGSQGVGSPTNRVLCVTESKPGGVTRCGRCAVAETTSYDEIMLASLLKGNRGRDPRETPCEDCWRLS